MTQLRASFTVVSQLEISTISSILLATPDKAVVRGSDRVPPRGLPTANGWHVFCVDENEELAEKTLLKLLDRVEPLLPKLRVLREQDGNAEVRFVIIIQPYSKEVCLYFSRETINKMAAFSGSFDIMFAESE